METSRSHRTDAPDIVDYLSEGFRTITLPRPIPRREAEERRVPRHLLTPCSIHGHRVSGVYTLHDQVESIEVPSWAETDQHWLKTWTASRILQTKHPNIVVAGCSAALLRGLPVRPAHHIHIAQRERGAIIAGRPVKTTRTRFVQSESLHALNVQTVPAMLATLAEELSTTDLVLVLDALLGPWHGPAQLLPIDLADIAHQLGHCRRKHRLFTAIRLARPGVGSPPETKLRLFLHSAGLTEALVNHPIDAPRLGITIHPDLAFPQFKVAIEYEGQHHRVDPKQWELDIRRYAELERLGWTVIRVTKESSLGQIASDIHDIKARLLSV